jgi:PAT family acetyl-CoA transporter-like MFS transporter 1
MLIGITLAMLSTKADDLLEAMDVSTLTAAFFWLYFLCATQDIAVDGWAITMLSSRNVGWQSTCNSMGQIIGSTASFLGYFKGTISIGQTLGLWSGAFIVTTLVVAIFKSERPDHDIDPVAKVYREIWAVMKLPNVRSLALIFLTWKIPFCATDSIAGLRLQKQGVTKETMASLSSYMTFVSLFISGWVSKHVTGANPMAIGMKVYLPRVLYGGVAAAVVYFTPPTEQQDYKYVAVLFCCVCFHTFVSQVMFVAQMSLVSRVADPRIGGTYMTLLNTLGNIGGTWTQTIAFPATQALTVGGVDGYYVLTALCMLCGFAWSSVGTPKMLALQKLPTESWRLEACKDRSSRGPTTTTTRATTTKTTRKSA